MMGEREQEKIENLFPCSVRWRGLGQVWQRQEINSYFFSELPAKPPNDFASWLFRIEDPTVDE